MKLFTQLRKILGVTTLQEQLYEFYDIEKSEQENIAFREILAEEQTSNLLAYNNRHSLSELEKAHIEDRYNSFLKDHKKEVKKAYSQFQDLEKRKKALLNDSKIQKALLLNKYTDAIQTIRKSNLSDEKQKDLEACCIQPGHHADAYGSTVCRGCRFCSACTR